MNVKDTIISVAKHRTIVAAWAVMFFLSIFLVVLTAFQVHYSELQTLTRYTAFGDTKLYSSQWFYLLNFVVFGLIILILHSLIALKLYDRKGNRLTLLFLGLSLAVLIIGYFTIFSVLNMVSLS